MHHQGLLSPEQAGIARRRHHGYVEVGVERGDTGRLKRHGLVDRLPRALRKQQYLASLADRTLRLIDHLAQRLAARRPVHQDHRITLQEPADQRQLAQLLLGDDAGIGEDHAKRRGLPQRLMIAGNDAGSIRNVRAPLDAIIQPHHIFHQEQDAVGPDLGHCPHRRTARLE